MPIGKLLNGRPACIQCGGAMPPLPARGPMGSPQNVDRAIAARRKVCSDACAVARETALQRADRQRRRSPSSRS